MNSMENLELAASKPLNSSRVIIDRRFQPREKSQDFPAQYQGQTTQSQNFGKVLKNQ